MAEYGEPWHVVREVKDSGPDAPTHVVVDHNPGETDPANGMPVLESADTDRLARAVACVNFLAGVPGAVLAGHTGDNELIQLILAVLKDPTDHGPQLDLAGRLNELTADEPHRI